MVDKSDGADHSPERWRTSSTKILVVVLLVQKLTQEVIQSYVSIVRKDAAKEFDGRFGCLGIVLFALGPACSDGLGLVRIILDPLFVESSESQAYEKILRKMIPHHGENNDSQQQLRQQQHLYNDKGKTPLCECSDDAHKRNSPRRQ